MTKLMAKKRLWIYVYGDMGKIVAPFEGNVEALVVYTFLFINVIKT